jgi:hypothetical protein
MSEYIELEPEETDDPHVLIIVSNITLTVQELEVYESADLMLEGSPLAQSLAVIPGIEHLRIEPDALTITRNPAYEWYTITEDIKAAIVDFFL